MELQDYGRILRQRWLLILLTMIVSVVTALLLTVSATPMYKSSARLFVTTAQSDGQDAYQGGLFSQQRVKSYANLLNGEEISRRVVEKLNLNESPRVLASKITATVEPDTVVMSISITDTSPQRAKELTQATAQVFVSYVSELETPPGKSNAPVKASIVDRATTPGGQISPQPARNLALALLLGLFVGGGLAVLRDATDNRIATEEDLVGPTKDAPILGNIHFDKSAEKIPLISGLNPRAPRVEAFRVLRTNLQFINVDGDNKVFVVTSAVPSEGKSSTACSLAITIAESGQRVLLIEGDLRRPRATHYMGLDNTVGVTTVLVGRVPLSDAIQTVNAGCDLLASGSTPPNPAELLQSVAMQQLLAEVRVNYDVVLIDAPPLLPVTDAALLASQSDGAILVVRHNSTTRDQVTSAVSRLESVDARLLGTVVTMSPQSKRSSSGYGYGYGYGYEPKAGRAKDRDSESRRTSKQSKQESKRASAQANHESKQQRKQAKQENKQRS